MKKFVLAFVALATPAVLATAASATTFDWTYGGAGDPVSASGTLVATPDASIAGAYDILSGSGTRTTSQGTFAVTIIGFSDPGPFPRSGGEGGTTCGTYTTSSNCDIHDAGAGGVTADLIFDLLLYPSEPAGSQLDGDGFVLFEPNAPANDSDYYAVWSAGSFGPPDQEFDPYTYDGVNLINPFTVTTATAYVATPEPDSLLLLGTGLLGLGVVLYRKAKPAPGMIVSL